jgi:hypothetical protein
VTFAERPIITRNRKTSALIDSPPYPMMTRSAFDWFITLHCLLVPFQRRLSDSPFCFPEPFREKRGCWRMAAVSAQNRSFPAWLR